MMRLPRPASPRALWRDIKAFAASHSGHRWAALAFAILIPAFVGILFMVDFREAHQRSPQLIYVESWRADRTMEETKAHIQKVEEQRQAIAAERQRQYKILENGLNKMGLD